MNTEKFENSVQSIEDTIDLIKKFNNCKYKKQWIKQLYESRDLIYYELVKNDRWENFE